MERLVEGQRGLELRISNAVFSKLIKMGRDQGMTPQRVGQALFDQAYEAACLGKGKPAAEAVPDQAELDRLIEVLAAEKPFVFDPATHFLHADDGGAPAHGVRYEPASASKDAWAARISELEAKLLRMTEKCEEQLDKREQEQAITCKLQDDLLAAIAERDQAQKTIASKDTMLLDQARQIREANAEIQQLRQRIEEECGAPAGAGDVVITGGLSPHLIEIVAAPAEPAIERLGPIVPVRAIKGMNAAGNSPAAIARDLGLDLAIVRQVLG